MTDEDLRRLFEGVVIDVRRHFDVTAEGLQKQIKGVADRVIRLDQNVDRTAGEIREEMRTGFAQMQANLSLPPLQDVVAVAVTKRYKPHAECSR